MKYQIINSDVYAGLFNIEDNHIDLAITSPPYWGQRDYGFKGQIGNENTFQEYIDKLLIIFLLLKDKLTDDGVFFLNIGDKYISKYGKTPLGLIPYQLAYHMVKEGWILNDILIWYKPNHMPSSVKNRFSNSYEPVFVFSKNEKNIFSFQNNGNNNYSNLLRVNLQPTPYKHVAVYPEKLVENLLKMVKLNNNATVLDPFAGSGTTLKVVKNYNNDLNAIMIENHNDYIEIMKERSGLNGSVDVVKYDFIPYSFKKDSLINKINLFEKNRDVVNQSKINKDGIVKIFENKKDYFNMLNMFLTKTIKYYLNLNATCFIGSKDFDIDLIYETSLLNNKGWVIRNMIIVQSQNRWFPVFMIVDDNKKINYSFNFKNLNLKSKTEYNRNWNLTNFIGFKVVSSIDKVKKEGKIIKIIRKLANGFPEYVIVYWEDQTYSKEFVIFSQEEINRTLIIEDNFDIRELHEFTQMDNHIELQSKDYGSVVINGFNNQNYNGKFKNEKRKNWGASPGARSSVEQEYFSIQRLYEVDQKLISDYLNYKRIQKGLSKQELTNLFPTNYKHTVGHWLRKDFGGSLPTKTDWLKLTKILDIEENVTHYICKSALKIQTVKNAEHKPPQDFININSLNIFNKLLDNPPKHLYNKLLA